ncbi:hypothetical protein GV054_20595 [Marinomonas mediterranea]|jgi:hypothetical protein|uniref:Uncharacterized protein n=1 Tax=Marinomonas mediterranea (strain ATCC 700492 / JCM 21426 / NBRC 103028 / MMB-1) TaxID=717774 RepID=F2K066_MARM1|nr:hypothetical protein [Marinomonas mediterranea]ADZ93280.1 hypothetical protein Marme_4077 [Marinomonas mediterranea MMB-1]WCN15231.1 hypothetical protein GV054_20595 [Marinomonas mediterranea]WCN19277.1 hypothetical protein GV053_20650 [Marinomonas mediterranea MMB-1]
MKINGQYQAVIVDDVFTMDLTTQGPFYPPSELMDNDGNFVVIGKIIGGDGSIRWGAATVSSDSEVPPFGQVAPYKIVKHLTLEEVKQSQTVLHTLPLPLPCNNYPMVFAPEQVPNAPDIKRPSLPLHLAHIPDIRPEDGRKVTAPITLQQWCQAHGTMRVRIPESQTEARFDFDFSGMIPNSLYTVMALRTHNINPDNPTRPGVLGVPNVFISDEEGNAKYCATMPNPFPKGDGADRIIDVIVLWISSQMSFGGAIGHFGLGGDIHAQLKFKQSPFSEYTTKTSADEA